MKVTRVLAVMMMAITVGLVSCKPKDADIKTAVEQAIKTHPGAEAVTVDVKEGVVTLAGEFKDETCKADCETAAKGVKGVKSVVDNGTIPAPVVAAPVVINPDDSLTHLVTDAVKDFPTVKADVKDGVVTLTGEINKANLIKLMQSVNGLKPKKVENKLTVK